MPIFTQKLKKIIKIIFTLLILVAAIFSYAYFIEPNSLKIYNQTFKLSCLNGDVPGKFVQISDLHFTEKTSEKRINQIYDAIRKENPSAVFITGDFISNKNGIAPAKKLAGKISEDYPVYAVFGNWDYWALNYNIDAFKTELENAGAKTLANDAAILEIGDEKIDLLGVNDPYTSGNTIGDLEKAMKKISGGRKNCSMLLAHSPDIVQTANNAEIDLVLVGHTHGGQVYIPFITEKLIPSHPDGRGFIKGLYKVGETQMYVNSGIGTSVLPLRFLVPPEVTVITLEKS